MSLFERAAVRALRLLDPESGHKVALKALNLGLVPLPGRITSPRLRCRVAGLELANPIGLAAGFDKNAEALGPLSRAGFGFLEVGAATPRPQPGNPRPRLFRLTEDEAVINRFGFNNEGMQAIGARLSNVRNRIPVGLNLGANKTSQDRSADYSKVLAHCEPWVDFVTVNVSSPNTEALRDLQRAEALSTLLAGVKAQRTNEKFPIFLKISPDLTDGEIVEIAEVAMTHALDGIVATNTTLSRTGLRSSHAHQAGGLSGKPLRELSTRVLARLARETGGQMPLIGVGGIASAEDAYQKIKVGASAVQLYSALAYRGIGLVAEIVRQLECLLEKDGFDNVSDAVGVDL